MLTVVVLLEEEGSSAHAPTAALEPAVAPKPTSAAFPTVEQVSVLLYREPKPEQAAALLQAFEQIASLADREHNDPDAASAPAPDVASPATDISLAPATDAAVASTLEGSSRSRYSSSYTNSPGQDYDDQEG